MVGEYKEYINFNDAPLTTSTPSITGSGSGGGFGLASIISGLGGVTGAVNVLGDLVGLDISRNLSLVKEYGWNSWNASTSPAEAVETWKIDVVPYVQRLVDGVNDLNFVETINELEKFLTYAIALQNYKLKHHSKANSTKEARKTIIGLNEELYNETVVKMLNGLKSAGVKVDYVIHNADDSEQNYTGASFNRDIGSWQHKIYSFDTSNVKVSQDGEISKTSSLDLASFSPIMVIALVGVAVGSLFKKIKFNKNTF